jgi:hypothetical protein
MRLLRLVFVVTILLSALVLAQSVSLAYSPLVSKDAALSQPDAAAQARVVADYGKLPLAFEANHGQTDAQVKFFSRTNAYSLFLTGDEAVFTLNAKKANAQNKEASSDFVSGHRFSDAVSITKADAPSGGDLSTRVLRMKLRNANAVVKVTGIDEQAATTNYFIGNDPVKWRTNVPTYAKVKYENIYSGIDLVYYGNQRQLEYDFIVSPGANPRSIAFNITGADKIRQDAHGDLVFQMNDKMGDEKIRWHKPVVYQEKNGAREEIAARYTITDKTRVGFELAKYDVTKPLYIDPLIYSTFLGGNNTDYSNAIAVDSTGNAYITGYTASTDFPTVNPVQPVNNLGIYDVFVSKINATGSALVYSTYLGGSGLDKGFAIAVDNAGSTYLTGVTSSGNFPTTPGAFQTSLGGRSNAFVTKINPAGSALVYSTYLGGNADDNYFGAAGIAVDSKGNAYVTGGTDSSNFPTKNPLQPYGGGNDAFVSKINSTGSALVYSTFLGGSNEDRGYGIALDSAGNAYVTGSTQSTNFPTMNPLQPSNAGPVNAFVSKINPTGSAFVYSTYLGGTGSDYGFGIAVDGTGSAYITGRAGSNFPTTPGAFQTTFGGGIADAFVSKINSAGSALVYSTYLGGSDYDDNYGGGIAVDSAGNAYVTGDTRSGDFPTVNPLQPHNTGNANGYVSKINPTGSALVYSTYLGGSASEQGTGVAVDSAGNAYVTGYADSADFPTMNPLQPNNAGGGDSFVAKINPSPTYETVAPLHLDFGNLSIGFASNAKVSTLTNASGATVTIASLGITGADAGDFTQTNTCGSSLAVGASCSISATFTPTAFGGRNAAITITDSAPDSPQSLSLTGYGLLDTSTKLASSLDPSSPGQLVKFTATVSSPMGGIPSGYVFFEGLNTSRRLVGGKASIATKTLPLGLTVVTAKYGGDPTYGPSTSAPLNQYVLPPTTTALTSSPNPSVKGQAVTFTATVSTGSGAPPNGETVSFMKGKTVLGTGTLTSGTATFTTSSLPVATSAITAVYGGDANLAPSKSNIVDQVVTQ